MAEAYHIPVLLKEVIEGLNIRKDGIYVDCTLGGGGHAREILEQLGPRGQLIAFDQDEEARQNMPADSRVVFVPQNFRHITRFLRLHEINQIDGVLADLGVSSHQFDEPSRGFSTRFDAKLDMRMDRRQTASAFDIVNNYTEEQLHKIFEQYGEVTNSKTLAKTIAEKRKTAKLDSVENFKLAIREIVRGNPNKYLAQVFQALRIEVNDELGALKELLQQVPGLLKPGGRAAIITFHSLEDRLVKNFFRRGSFEETDEHPFFNSESTNEMKLVTKKPIIPQEAERMGNPRSRSAKLRIAEKTIYAGTAKP